VTPNEIVHAEKAHFGVKELCRAAGASRSGYYAWAKRQRASRALSDERLLVEIRAIYKRKRRRYGSPRVYNELKARGVRTSEKRVARLMRQDGLIARRKRRFRRTTNSNHKHPIAPNLLEQNFTASEPNRVWVGDITYVWTLQGWLYVAVLIDLYSRRVVGWAASRRITRELALRALAMAVARRGPPRGLIHHTDRGSQYASGDYQDALRQHGMVCSMSGKGNCFDNAVAESFFATLKKELVHRRIFFTREQATRELADYIEHFYNAERSHSAIGYLSPIHYELFNQAALAA